MTKFCPSHGRVMAMLLPSHVQVMDKLCPSHGQVMPNLFPVTASLRKSFQSHSCHIKPNLCTSHDLVISKSWPSYGQSWQVMASHSMS